MWARTCTVTSADCTPCPTTSAFAPTPSGPAPDASVVLIGNGGLYYPQSLQRGADGAMTGFAYPDVLVQVYERFTAGDVETAEDFYDRYLPLVCYEQQPGYGLAVRKEILRRRGAIRSSTVRVPGPSLTAVDSAEIDRLMARVAAAAVR